MIKRRWQETLEIFLMRYINLFILLYISLRVFFFFHYPTTGYLRILVVIFLGAEAFFLIHAFGYFRYLRQVTKLQAINPHHMDIPELKSYPPVAIVVASYKEPLSVLEDTLICFHNLTYPNKQLYFLDDTRYDQPWDTPEKVQEYKLAVENLCRFIGINLFRRKWHHAKAGIINDFLDHMQGKKRDDFVLMRFDDASWAGEEKYIAIFDADMNPMSNFVEPLVALMESKPDVALVQTPQYYTNYKESHVAKAASLMQVVFYEWICEAKGLQNLTIFCGSNVLLRVDALKAVGGLDLSSVTEDFATTFNLHKSHWKTVYLNKICAFGMGPEDLGAFFKQQDRWARGTVSMLPKTLFTFLRHPFKFPLSFYWEYFLSSSYYLVGWMYFILFLGPMLYILLDIRLYQFPTWLYAIAMVPYSLITNFLFYWTLAKRGYRVRDLSLGTTLGTLTTPVYMKAAVQGLFGLPGSFVVTPKGRINVLPLRDLWPQVTLAIVAFITMVWGSLRLLHEGEPFFGLVFNMFWITYYFTIFASIFYFNQPEAQSGE